MEMTSEEGNEGYLTAKIETRFPDDPDTLDVQGLEIQPRDMPSFPHIPKLIYFEGFLQVIPTAASRVQARECSSLFQQPSRCF